MISRRQKSWLFRGRAFNYWSADDEWAYAKGGIGAYGNDLAEIEDLNWITNREFAPGAKLHGYRLPRKEFGEFDHSDYMATTAFFELIHGHDVARAVDTLLSGHSSIDFLKHLARTW